MHQYYLAFNNNMAFRYSSEFHIDNIPENAIEVSESIWKKSIARPPINKKWAIIDDELVLVDIIYSDEDIKAKKIVAQTDAIAAFINAKIHAPALDYENAAEAYAWRNDVEYGSEATAVHEWCISCQKIQFKIKISEIEFDDVDSALASLPDFIY